MRHRALYGGMIVLECLLWGLGNPIIKIAGQSLLPFTAIALRFVLALAVYLAVFGRRVIKNLPSVRWGPTLAVCVSTALAFTLGSFALLLTEAMIAGFLMGIAVLFTPFLEPLILKTRFRPRILPLVALVCAGMYLLCGGGAFTFGWGEGLAVLCSFAFAVMLTLSEKYIGDMDTITLSTLQCAVAAVIATACMVAFEGGRGLARMNPRGMGAVLYLALGSTCAAYLLQNRAMRHIPATFASLAFCMEPVFTVLFSYLLLGETLSGTGFLGAGIILAGVMAASVMKEAGADGRTGID